MARQTRSTISRPRIHITALASPAAGEIDRLRVDGVPGLAALAQEGAGDGYRVTANKAMITAREIDNEGGRRDDAARVRELNGLLADESLAALVTLRGGAWFVRLLDQIEFDRLARRKRPLYIFGFSEMTPLIAIAGQFPKVVALYDLGPAFLFGGLRRHVRMNMSGYARGVTVPAGQEDSFAGGWAAAHYPRMFREFFGEVASIIEGRGCPRVPTGKLLSGKLAATQKIRMTGGNVSLISATIPSPRHLPAMDPAGKWLALEEVGELPEQFDRMMAGFKVAGFFERAEGVILGDFHRNDDDYAAASLDVLRYHLPNRRDFPVVRIENFGHIWPIAPMPMHREVALRHDRRSGRVTIDIPWGRWAVK